jgi:hypothetical protein
MVYPEYIWYILAISILNDIAGTIYMVYTWYIPIIGVPDEKSMMIKQN